jgi:hypothetical protein
LSQSASEELDCIILKGDREREREREGRRNMNTNTGLLLY